jgi:hypothetical protein
MPDHLANEKQLFECNRPRCTQKLIRFKVNVEHIYPTQRIKKRTKESAWQGAHMVIVNIYLHYAILNYSLMDNKH